RRSIDDRALFARETVIQGCEPSFHRIEVGNDGLCRNDARDADFRIGLVVCKQNFVEPLAWPDAGEHDFNIALWFETGEADYAFGKLHDSHRLPHVEHID